ncbi:MAG: PAS domain S-box protein, partial [Bryobacteraceae bacterium]
DLSRQAAEVGKPHADRLRQLVEARLARLEQIEQMEPGDPRHTSGVLEGQAATDRIRAELAALQSDAEERGRQDAERVGQWRTAMDLTIFLGALLGVAGVVVALRLWLGVAGRIKRLEGASEDLAAGRPVELTPSGSDEIARVERGLVEAGELLRARTAALRGEGQVLETIARGVPLEESLASVVRWIDSRISGASSIRVPARGMHVSGRPELEALHKDIEGLGGAAAIACSDISADPRWAACRELAASRQVAACWIAPIVPPDPQGIAGTLAVFYREPRRPSAEEARILDRALDVARIGIEQSRMAGFRAIIENAPDVTLILDSEGAIGYASVSVGRVLGYHPDELEGKSVLDLICPDDQPAARAAFAARLGTPGREAPVERRFLHKDGSTRVVELASNNLLDHPRIRGLVVNAQDVTARRAAQDAVIAGEQRYRELFEYASDVIYTHDLAGRFTTVNRAAEVCSGYRRDELLGKSIHDFVAPESRGLVEQMIARKIGGEPQTLYEIDVVARDGSRLPFEVSTRLIFADGRPVGVQGIGRNVAERKRLESQLRQSQRMEVIGRLAGGVAHDFNNLLTVITGYSQWILDDMSQQGSMREEVLEIRLAASRAAALTSQLLGVSRNQVAQPLIIDPNAVVASMDRMLRRVIGEDIELVTTMSHHIGRVRLGSGQMEQVILNLVVNARDAMPLGGKVIIETANVELDEECAGARPGRYVMLTIADTGMGMDAETQARVFEPFFTTKDVGKGTGLGLSLVYGIVKQSSGTVLLESTPGVGSVFRIFFPRVMEEVGAPESVAPRLPIPHGAETILVVEDENGVRRMVRDMLRRLGYRILEAADGPAALKLVRDHSQPIHLLLTDVVMPGLDGRELAESLMPLCGGLKVLYMSGYTDDAILRHGLQQIGMLFLAKPFTPDDLAQKVREALDS